MLGVRRIKFLGVLVAAWLPTSCKCQYPVITSLDVTPQWVCSGSDWSGRVRFRVEQHNRHGKPEADNKDFGVLELWDTTDVEPYDGSKITSATQGAVKVYTKTSKLTNVPPLSKPAPNVYESPGDGIVVSSSTTSKRRFTLTLTSQNDCGKDADKKVLANQERIESITGQPLDDKTAMQANVEVLVVSTPVDRPICVPYSTRASLQQPTWVKNEGRGGVGIAMEYVENTNDFAVEVEHVLPQPFGSVFRRLEPNSRSDAFGGRSPNGDWRIHIPDQAERDRYFAHGVDYVGIPPVCLNLRLMCSEPTP